MDLNVLALVLSVMAVVSALLAIVMRIIAAQKFAAEQAAKPPRPKAPSLVGPCRHCGCMRVRRFCAQCGRIVYRNGDSGFIAF